MSTATYPQLPLRRFLLDIVDGPFGSSMTSSHYSDSGARVVRLGNIGHARFRSADEAYVPMEYFRQLRRHEVRAGDLLIAGLGDETHHVGRGCVAPTSLGPAIVKADCFRARLDQHRLLHSYAAWALSSSFVAAQIATLTRGSTRARINLDVAKEIPIPVPPIDRQHQIAEFLNRETARIDRLAGTYQSTIDVLLDRRAAGVHASVTGASFTRHRQSGLAWAKTVPEHWKSLKLGLVARMGSGHTPSRSHPEWWVDCTIPWITTGEVSQVRDDRQEVITETRESISKLGLANSAAELCPAGTVVLCRTASAGYSAVMGADMATSQDFVTWQCSPVLNPFYLLWTLRAMRPDLLGRLAMGSTHKTIYVPDLQMLRIALPPLEEQKAIVAAIRAANARIDAAIDAIKQQQSLLAERKQALITAAVTGQLETDSLIGYS